MGDVQILVNPFNQVVTGMGELEWPGSQNTSLVNEFGPDVTKFHSKGGTKKGISQEIAYIPNKECVLFEGTL